MEKKIISDFENTYKNSLLTDEVKFRKEFLSKFLEKGFPSKKLESWKFSDLNFILSQNFNNIQNNEFLPKNNNLKLIDEFEHNFISLFNSKIFLASCISSSDWPTVTAI